MIITNSKKNICSYMYNHHNIFAIFDCFLIRQRILTARVALFLNNIIQYNSKHPVMIEKWETQGPPLQRVWAHGYIKYYRGGNHHCQSHDYHMITTKMSHQPLPQRGNKFDVMADYGHGASGVILSRNSWQRKQFFF